LLAIAHKLIGAAIAAAATALIASPAPVLSQMATLRVAVVSTGSGRPVVGATASVPAAARQTRTDSLGRLLTREERLREQGRSLDELFRAMVPGLRI
jgi:hypothetical protein